MEKEGFTSMRTLQNLRRVSLAAVVLLLTTFFFQGFQVATISASGQNTTDASSKIGLQQTADTLIQNVTLNPASPVGLQTVTFEVEFNKPMDQNVIPNLTFTSSRAGSWDIINQNNGLPTGYLYPTDVLTLLLDNESNQWFGNYGDTFLSRLNGSNWTYYNGSNWVLNNRGWVYSSLFDHNGIRWFGTISGLVRYNGTNFTLFDPSNSGLGHIWVGERSLVLDPDGSLWVSAIDHGNSADNRWSVSKVQGNSITNVFNPSNTPIGTGGSNPIVRLQAIDTNGVKWFALGGRDFTPSEGIASFNGTSWNIYNSANSNIPNVGVNALAIDSQGNKWLGTNGGGLVKFNGASWTIYNTSNSPIPSDFVYNVSIDKYDRVWLGTNRGSTGDGAARFDGTNWTIFTTANSGIPSNAIYQIRFNQTDGTVWFATVGGGVGIYHDPKTYSIVNNQQWLSPTVFRATYTFTSAVPTGTYILSVNGARGNDGVNQTSYSGTTFTVAYTNQAPQVNAGGMYNVNAGSSVTLNGTATDPNPGDVLNYAWDLDNNGSFETQGQNPPFSAIGLLPGTRTIVLRACDDKLLCATSNATINVNSSITITTASPLATGTVGIGYTITLQATGGTNPYTWLVTGGSLPPGLILSNGGVLSGTPTTSGNYTFVVTATDSSNLQGSKTIIMTVLPVTGSKISPVLECVTNNGDGTYTAYFGYNNPNSLIVTIPLGSNNRFTPNPQDRGQPTTFETGRRVSVFSVIFNGSNLVWTLNGKTSTASANSKRCN
jgi:Putative Ig domain